MKTILKALLMVILLSGGFILYILSSSGFFREIEPILDGKIIQKIPIAGAEDIMVFTSDDFALVSATDRAMWSDTYRSGGLYYLDLKADELTPVLLDHTANTEFQPHGISAYKKDSIYHLAVINHANSQHTIEIFELVQSQLTHKKTLKDKSMIQPNDVLLINEDQLYFTNDHGYTKGVGKFMEEYLGLALSNVVYFDGQTYQEVADDIAYANGINLDKTRNLMFISSPRDFSVKVYDRLEDGSLSFIEDIPCGTGVDNIEFDTQGDLLIGCHPNLLQLASFRRDSSAYSPSEVIRVNYKEKGAYTVEKIYIEDGSDMSASSVATVYEDLLFVGSAVDTKFLVLEMK